MVDFLRKGGFKKSLAKEAVDFTGCLEDDKRIALCDISNSQAHSIMLFEQKILSKKELSDILTALEKARGEWLEQTFILDIELEDIHPNVEKYVSSQSSSGEKMHSGRSRNDQVATDIRMYARDEILELTSLSLDLASKLVYLAKNNQSTVFPGFTHTQPAQATTFGHYLIAYAHQLLRDVERLELSFRQTNQSPLGACALAGTTFPINRQRTAELLGFDSVLPSPLDSVSSRDYSTQTQFAAASLMTTLARIAEDVILFTTLGLIEVDDSYAYTSSAMPQKRDPYVAETIRAKCARTSALLSASLGILKGMPTGYNKDYQDLKPLLWESFDETKASLKAAIGLVGAVSVKKTAALEFCRQKFVCAIDLAEYLALAKQVPFRKAHTIVGALAKSGAITAQKVVSETKSVAGLKISFSQNELNSCLDPQTSVKKKGLVSSKEYLDLEKTISFSRALLSQRRKKIVDANKNLTHLVAKLS